MWDSGAMDLLTSFVDGIKSDRLGYVKGYLVRFGDTKTADLEGDFFTKSTDYGFPMTEGKRVPLNVYYHHGMDSMVGKKSIGTGYIKMDDVGLWYEAQLDMADEYGTMIAKLCKQGKMGFSSGAAGHLVERKSMGGAAEITRWPIAEASITPTPAEYRNSVKSLQDIFEMQETKAELRVDDYVTWNSAGGKARGQIVAISDSGPLSPEPKGDPQIGRAGNPVYKIQVLAQQGDELVLSKVSVVHRQDALTKIKKPAKGYGMDPMMGMDMYGMEEEEMVMAPMPEQSPEEYAVSVFDESEGDLIHEGLEAYYDALCGAIEAVSDQAMADAIIDEFARRAKGLYAMHGMKSVQPASLRGVERRLRDAVGLSRTSAKRLAPVVWDSLRDADQPETQPDIVVEAKAHDNDERQDLLARLELLTQL